MQRHTFVALIGVGVILSSLAGCVSRMTVDLTRPPQIAFQDAEYFSVFSLEPSWRDSSFYAPLLLGNEERDELAVIGLLNEKLSGMIYRTGVYQLLQPQEAQSRELYFSGSILSFSSDVLVTLRKSKSHEDDDSETDGQEEPRPTIEVRFSRRVSMAFSYQLVDARSNQILDLGVRRYDWRSGEVEDLQNLPPLFLLAEADLNSFVEDIRKKTQSYTSRFDLSFEWGQGPDMREARDRMKQGDFRAALSVYQNLYELTGEFGAGYNAALLAFVLDGAEASILRLQQLQNRFPRPKVATALAKISDALAPSRVDQIVVQVENENYQIAR